MSVVSIKLSGKMVRGKSALTPALSPRRGRPATTRLESSNVLRTLSDSLKFKVCGSKGKDVLAGHKTRRTFLPLPGGEGRGEGERSSNS